MFEKTIFHETGILIFPTPLEWPIKIFKKLYFAIFGCWLVCHVNFLIGIQKKDMHILQTIFLNFTHQNLHFKTLTVSSKNLNVSSLAMRSYENT